jgi:cystathionine beta-lyase/cystathionine gamma-synthase
VNHHAAQGESSNIETLAVHAGEPRSGPEGSFVFPIFQSTIYRIEPGAGYHGLQYIRLNSTPTQRYLHDKLAALEGGEAAVATASGMAAITSTFLTLLQKGDHFLATDSLYGGTHDFVTHDAERLGWTYTFVDASRPETWRAALQPNTKMFFTETISNPLLGVPRLDAIAEFGHEHGIVTMIDNTFASPVNFNPISVGFDLVIHSATKYLNGHDDLVAGCVIGRQDLIERVRKTVNHHGGCLDPHAAFLVARGLKTLALRVRAQNANAMALATFLSEHPKVENVRYPGLSSHPDCEVARALFKGFGGMLNFRLRGGPVAAERVMAALSIAYVAPGLGGVETLVLRPSTTSHAGLRPEERYRLGITDELLRVSCGIEHADDLIEDFRQALEQA